MHRHPRHLLRHQPRPPPEPLLVAVPPLCAPLVWPADREPRHGHRRDGARAQAREEGGPARVRPLVQEEPRRLQQPPAPCLEFAFSVRTINGLFQRQEYMYAINEKDIVRYTIGVSVIILCLLPVPPSLVYVRCCSTCLSSGALSSGRGPEAHQGASCRRAHDAIFGAKSALPAFCSHRFTSLNASFWPLFLCAKYLHTNPTVLSAAVMSPSSHMS